MKTFTISKRVLTHYGRRYSVDFRVRRTPYGKLEFSVQRVSGSGAYIELTQDDVADLINYLQKESGQ